MFDEAKILMREEQYTDAISLFNKVIMDNPWNFEAWKGICESYSMCGQIDSAQLMAKKSMSYFRGNEELVKFYSNLFWSFEAYEYSAYWYDIVYKMEPSELNRAILVLSYKYSGIDAYKSGQWEKSALYFESALKYDSTQQDLYQIVASAWIQIKEYKKALDVINNGFKIFPGDKNLKQIQKYVLFQQKDYQTLVEIYEQNAREHPDNLDAGLELAQLYLALGKGTETQLEFQRLKEKFQGNPKLYNAIAEYWRNLLMFDKERETYLELLRYHPDADSIYLKIAETYSNENKWSNARSSYRAYLEKHPGDLTALSLVAISYEKEAAYDSALVIYGEIVKNYPSNADIFRRAGNTAMIIGKADTALEYYRRWCEINPKDPEAWTAQGLAFEKLGNTANARHAYEQAENLKGNSISAFRLSLILRETDEIDIARRLQFLALRRSIDELARKEQSISAILSQDTTIGITELRKVSSETESLRKSRNTIFDIVDHWFPNRTDPELESELNKLLREYPNAPVLLEILADISMEKGDRTNANSLYEKLLRQEPSSIKGHLMLGEIKEANGELDTALKFYMQAVEINLSQKNMDEGTSNAYRAAIKVAEEINKLNLLANRWKQLHTIYKDDVQLTQNLIEVLHKLGMMDEARKLAEEK
ncbi:MAG TPA: tetratricopeptide repeat protein [Candidatus Marinimicrobia bacterium]|nr:tetratricopeptide repeat protein [Candidatus Neomarinimicrobiota bacterium]